MGHGSGDDAAVDVGVQQYCHGGDGAAANVEGGRWCCRGSGGSGGTAVAGVVRVLTWPLGGECGSKVQSGSAMYWI
jgi:hypothetical protein